MTGSVSQKGDGEAEHGPVQKVARRNIAGVLPLP
jgi:hypothetical protein